MVAVVSVLVSGTSHISCSAVVYDTAPPQARQRSESRGGNSDSGQTDCQQSVSFSLVSEQYAHVRTNGEGDADGHSLIASDE